MDSLHIEQICNILGDPKTGPTSNEVETYLNQVGAPESFKDVPNRFRLYNAFSAKQTRENNDDHILAFIEAVMNPERFVGREHFHESERQKLNQPLATAGYELTQHGKLEPFEQHAPDSNHTRLKNWFENHGKPDFSE